MYIWLKQSHPINLILRKQKNARYKQNLSLKITIIKKIKYIVYK